MFNKKKKTVLTKEQELQVRAQMELNKKIARVNKSISELLSKEGVTLVVDHQIKIVPMRPKPQPKK